VVCGEEVNKKGEIMKKIRLKRLTLYNFKGFSFTLEPEGEDANVFGRNASGKTTLADAFAWLLHDKDSLGKSDFEIKNINARGETEHGLDHVVEAVLDVDGTNVTLKKLYQERWAKVRGNVEPVFSGNTTDYFINAVPVKKIEYVHAVAEMAGDEGAFRLLTSPEIFPSLHWTKQRQILLEICGDITDADVISSDSSLAPLTDILGARSMDDHKKVVQVRKSEINKEIEKIPVRIDEVRRGMPEVSGLVRVDIEKDIQRTEIHLNDAKLRLQGIDNAKEIVDLTKALTVIESDIYRIEQRHYNEVMLEVGRINQQIADIKNAAESEERMVSRINSSILGREGDVRVIEGRLSDLRNKWKAIDDEEFSESIESICPGCGQYLPEDRVEEARQNALAEFNRRKSKRLTQIEEDGKAQKRVMDGHLSEIKELKNSLNQRPDIKAGDTAKLTEDRDRIRATATAYDGISARVTLIAQKDELVKKIETAKTSSAPDKEKIAADIRELTSNLSERKTQADAFLKREQGEKRIEELKTSEKTLAMEYERLEQELYLCEAFIKTKVRLLTDRINSHFELVRFKLFEVQVNGYLSETCEITVNGIGFNSNLNNAGRINGGMDVCRTLSRHYGLAAPIFVDNAESVCELIRMDTQVIRLVVSEADEKLRVEISNKDQRRAA
jgi:hypothetical protein